MPSTYNGIGTHYYGKKHLQVRPGACPHCGRGVELKSYDTRLWFVVFFIPLIPLGRKRIIDYCPACTRHYSVEAEKWETAKQLEVSGALDKFRAAATPEAAIETHQALLNYHEHEQAAAFRATMRQRFADNATVHAYLGAALTHFGKVDEAVADFARALELRPDLPEARVGVAKEHLRQNRLDEARKLLDFMEQPGAAQLYSLAPLEDLAYALQGANRHTEALQLFGKLLAAYPALAQNRHFRKRIQTSEKLTQAPTILPKKKFSWRELFHRQSQAPAQGPTFSRSGLIVLGSIAALVVLGLTLGNYYVQQHRTLFVVNGFKTPAQVQIDGQPAITARPGVTEVKLPEGRHHARITGSSRQELDFEMRAGYFGRWFDSPAWVLNVGGSALLLFQESIYSRNAREGDFQFHYGQPFLAFKKVTHPFRPLPEAVRMKEYEERTLTHLELLSGDKEVLNLFYHHLQGQRIGEALRLAEWRLGVRPDDEAMVVAYVRVAQVNESARLMKFLRAGLTNRPVVMEWHRAYQSLSGGRRNTEELAALYTSMLDAEPTNSSLLYLRGRLCATQQEAGKWFERAREADPVNPYPYFALGYYHLGRGDFVTARPLLERAARFRPSSEDFVRTFRVARLGLREFAELEEESRMRLKKSSDDYSAVYELSEILALQNKRAEAESVLTGYERRLPARDRQSFRPSLDFLYRSALYTAGDFVALEKHATRDRTPAGTNMLFYALIEQNRVADAARLHGTNDPLILEPMHCVALSLAWALAGDRSQADVWRERAAQRFEAGLRGDPRAATMLRDVAPPSLESIQELIDTPKTKATMLALFAACHPAQAATLKAEARKLNVDPTYPYHLVQRATVVP